MVKSLWLILLSSACMRADVSDYAVSGEALREPVVASFFAEATKDKSAETGAKTEAWVAEVGAALMSALQAINPFATKPRSGTLAIGIVPIHGEIHADRSFVREFWHYARNDDIDAIVLDISSGGGHAGVSEELVEAIMQVRQNTKKPVIAFVKDICASAAYWLAAAADVIIAQRPALVGSIGAYWQKELDKDIIEVTIAAGDYKYPAIDPQTGTLDPKFKEIIEGNIKRTHLIFCERVAQLRNLPVDQVVAQQARIYIAEDALKEGLIDGIGGMTEVLAAIQQRLAPVRIRGLTPGRARLVMPDGDGYTIEMTAQV